MTAPAAFRATYSDWKLIRSRKVVQIVMEVPIEAAGQAYDVLGGMPNPAAEVWCGIARINPESEVSETSPAPTVPSSPNPPARAKKSWKEMDYAQQAGVLCNDPKFCRFIAEKEQWSDITPTEVAGYIRNLCEVATRSDILPGTRAERRWLLLVSAYRAWELAPSAGAA